MYVGFSLWYVYVYACIIHWNFATEVWRFKQIFFHRKKIDPTPLCHDRDYTKFLSLFVCLSVFSFILFVCKRPKGCVVPLKSSKREREINKKKLFFRTATEHWKKQNDREKAIQQNGIRKDLEPQPLKILWNCWCNECNKREKNIHPTYKII